MNQFVTPEQAVKAAKRAGPPGLPIEIANQMCTAYAAQAASRNRCGAVRDPEDDEILSRMVEWCQAWKFDPAHPSRALPKGRIPRKEETVSRFGPGPTQGLDRVGGTFEEAWAPLRLLIRLKREEDRRQEVRHAPLATLEASHEGQLEHWVGKETKWREGIGGEGRGLVGEHAAADGARGARDAQSREGQVWVIRGIITPEPSSIFFTQKTGKTWFAWPRPFHGPRCL